MQALTCLVSLGPIPPGAYVHNYYVQAVVMFMIIAGGLGFMVWVELIQYPKKRKLSLHARVVLIFSVLLWVGVQPHRSAGVEQPRQHGKPQRRG